MTPDDDRLTRHLQQQADALTLAPADAASVMRRGARRRARRRAGVVGGLAVVGVLATTLAVRDAGSDQQLDIAVAPNVAPSSLDWSVVEPTSGLGYGERTAQLADGSLFGISTAPGPYDPDDPEASLSGALYRSTDGTEWEPLAFPAASRPADLAGAGDTLFGLGTAPSGGLVLSTSRDGADTWSEAELGAEVAQLRATYGDRVMVGVPQVAAADAAHVVAIVTVWTSEDLSRFLPELTYDTHTWTWGPDGVEVFEVAFEGCDVAAAGLPPEAGRAAGEANGLECGREAVASDESTGDPVATFTYEELGIVGELRDHVGGRTYVYVSDDGTTFDRVDLPVEAEPGRRIGTVVPLATPDGFRLAVGRFGDGAGSDTTVLRSADGRQWDVTATIPGDLDDLGLLAGRPALSGWTSDGWSVQVEQADGVWTVVDLTSAVATPDGKETWLGDVAFGPLGLAAAVHTTDAEDGGDLTTHIVHSADGSHLEVLAVDDVLGEHRGSVLGVVVTADAVFVRLGDPTDGDLDTPPTQTVLVGTPAG